MKQRMNFGNVAHKVFNFPICDETAHYFSVYRTTNIPKSKHSEKEKK